MTSPTRSTGRALSPAHSFTDSELDAAALHVSNLVTQLYCAKAAAYWAVTRDHRSVLIRLYREIREAEIAMPEAVQRYRDAEAAIRAEQAQFRERA